jgi:hypothetical protein
MKNGKVIAELAITKGTPPRNHDQKFACSTVYALMLLQLNLSC